MAMDFSGVKRWVEPSMWLLKVTPSSSILRVLRQRKDLEAARIGQHGMRPVHELVQPAHIAHQLVAGAQVEVIGVAEHQRGAQLSQLRRRERLDGGLRADRRKDRREQVAVRGGEYAGAGAGILGCELVIRTRGRL